MLESLILTGANAYTKTNIFAGEVRGNSDTIDGDVTFFGPGVLTFAETRTSSSNFFGSITGPGRVVVNRGSSFIPLTLFGKNNYTGGTTLNDGILSGTSNSLQGPISPTIRSQIEQNLMEPIQATWRAPATPHL